MYQYDNETVNYSFSELKTQKKHKLLGLSLLWFSLGIFITILFSGVIASIPSVYISWISFTLSVGIAPQTFIYVSIIVEFIACFIFQLFFAYKKNKKISIVMSIIAYFAYVLISTASLTFFTLALNAYSQLNMAHAILMFIIPIAMFAIVGVLGYFDKVDFSKFTWIVTVGIIATVVMWIISFFTVFRSNKIWSLYFALMIIVSLVIIGFNFQIIKKYDVELENSDKNNLVIVGLSITFGFNLYILFIGLIWKVLMLMLRNK
ncbi:MAG0110 family membrane protein [Mycoplasma zalophi]|uniref:Bax inhibitor-1 family protein n=1 Tax=Mycoplasma zalophi TaxID=191287 RepID=A0ABS6DNY9_9MOLU|nr:Bax inhibitor-1 family protein [Mycoplasma zalophi]MBU4691193.1 Bax inhibitor-1 family protein [Mycoplasma zalophi]MBU4692032.1 Bax inhibitor-1 family protein [Mycoplasma zalophi]